MGLKFRGGLLGLNNAGAKPPVVQEKGDDAESQQQQQGVFEKEPNPTTKNADPVDEKKELQFGVQVAEATLQVWSKHHLIAAYIL